MCVLNRLGLLFRPFPPSSRSNSGVSGSVVGYLSFCRRRRERAHCLGAFVGRGGRSGYMPPPLGIGVLRPSAAANDVSSLKGVASSAPGQGRKGDPMGERRGTGGRRRTRKEGRRKKKGFGRKEGRRPAWKQQPLLSLLYAKESKFGVEAVGGRSRRRPLTVRGGGGRRRGGLAFSATGFFCASSSSSLSFLLTTGFFFFFESSLFLLLLFSPPSTFSSCQASSSSFLFLRRRR